MKFLQGLKNFRKGCERDFTAAAKFSQPLRKCLQILTFELFVFFPLHPHVIVFFLYILVICNDFLVVYNTPKKTLYIQFLVWNY